MPDACISHVADNCCRLLEADFLIFFPRAAGVCAEIDTTSGTRQISEKTLYCRMENNKQQPENLFDMGYFLIFVVLHPQL